MDDLLVVVDVSSLERRGVNLEDYWRTKIALYVHKKRLASRKGQKELSVPRQTFSLIENAKLNFTLSMLLEALEAVGGDISEAFQSHVPKTLHKEDQALHEMLQQVLDTKDPHAVSVIQHTVRSAFDSFVEKRKS